MNKQYRLINGLIVLFAFVSSGLIYSSLPNIMAIHWNIDGVADGFGNKRFALFVTPGIMLALFLLFTLLPLNTQLKLKLERFSISYDYISCIVLIFMAYIHVLIITANLEQNFNSLKYTISGMALLFMFIGNLLPKTKLNAVMGIRTPWTLDNEQVWFLTHRLAGRLVVGISLFVFIANFVGLNPVVSICLLIGSFLIPAVYSYVISKKYSV